MQDHREIESSLFGAGVGFKDNKDKIIVPTDCGTSADITSVLSVYFSGTTFSCSDLGNMAGNLFNNTKGKKVNNPNTNPVSSFSGNEYKMGFDGCGVTNGLSGTLFGTGLEEQCKEVVKYVHSLLKDGKKVILNCYGHSRGGIAALMLAKMLGGFAKDLVEVNLALLDPVPGNLILL